MERERRPQDSSGAHPGGAFERAPRREPEPLPFPALAEAHRRAGRARDAERVAREGLSQEPDRPGGRVALGLALLDQGRLEEARREFERALGASIAPAPDAAVPGPRDPDAGHRTAWPPPPAEPALAEGLEQEELDRAFAEAKPDADEVVDADRIAQEAMRLADLDGPEPPRPHFRSPLATRTMADLLERQGDRDGAQAIRAGLGEREPQAEEAPPPPPRDAASAPSRAPAGRRRAMAALERWLANLRRS